MSELELFLDRHNHRLDSSAEALIATGSALSPAARDAAIKDFVRLFPQFDSEEVFVEYTKRYRSRFIMAD